MIEQTTQTRPAIIFSVTVAACGLALAARVALDPLLGDHLPFVTFFVAVVAAAWVGGWRAGLLAAGLGFALSVYFFVPPRRSLAPPSSGPHLVGLAMYCMVSLAIAGFGEAMRAARRREAEQTERLRTTLASIGDAVITTDAAGRVTGLNAVAEALTGWTTAEAAGRPLDDVFRIVNEETRKAVESPAARAIREGAVVGLANHTVLVAKDGTERPIDDSAAPIRGRAGEVVGCVLVFRDISERHRAEADREDARQQMAATLESITDGFMRFDRDWRVVYLNAEAERICQRPRADLLGRSHWELFPATAGTRLEAEYRRAVADRVTVEVENYYEPWGRWFTVRGFPTADGGLAVYFRDITDRKRADEELRRQTSTLRAVTDTTTDLIYVKDRDSRLSFANPATLAVLGVAEPQAAGGDMAGLIPDPAEAEAITANDRRIMASGEAEAVEEVFTGPHGTRTYLSTKTPLRDAAGQVVGLVGISRDITDRKEAEEQLREAAERLQLATDAAEMGGWEWIVPTGEVVWTTKTRELFGVDADVPITFDVFRSRLHPDDVAANDLKAEEGLTTGRYENEYRVRRGDGSYRWIATRGKVLPGDDGRPARMLGVVTDTTDRRQAEAALRDSEAHFRSMADNAPTMLWVTDPAGSCTYLSRQWYEYTGLPVGRGLGLGWLESVHPDDRRAAGDAFHDACRRHAPFAIDCRVRRHDGEYRWAVDAGRPRLGPGGDFLGYVGTVTDVHERRQGEEALRASEGRFRTLADSAPVLMWQTAPTGVVFVNRHYLAFFGVGFEAIAGMGWATFLHPDDHAAYVEAYRSAFGRREGYEFRCRFRRHDGEWRWMHNVGSPHFGPDGAFLGFVGCSSDVTNIIRAEEAVRASEQFNRSLMDGSVDCVKVLDPDGRLLHMNGPGLCVMEIDDFGPLCGREWPSLWPADSRDVLRQAVATAGGGRTNTFEAFCPTAKGTPKWWDVTVSPVRDAEDGPVVRLLAVSRDITERKQIEEALRQADRRKDEFLATLAHELRNPLAPVRNGLQIMKLAGGDPAAVEKARGMMERQVEQMAHLIDDLMDLSRISRGKIALQKTRLPVSAAVRDAVDTSRPLIDRQGHQLTVDVPDEPIYVDGDATRLTQIFANLLNNAAKYTDPGGRIRLAVERDGGEVAVSVEDNGVGIPAHMLPKVFDMFSQVDRSLEKAQGGLGIGLNIVKRLVEMHGGTISVESGGYGSGSTFTVRLPVVLAVAAERSDDLTGVPKAKAARRRILVVDDNRDGADSLAAMLRIMGNETQTAHDGLEAVAVAEAFLPDVILMDIGMPRLNGFDACRRIREHPWGTGLVVVACTGWGQEDDKRKSQEAGFDFHMVKPVDPAALEKLLAGMKVREQTG